MTDQPDPLPVDPDCAGGKHRACSGTAWDDNLDALAPCGCDVVTIAPGRAVGRGVVGYPVDGPVPEVDWRAAYARVAAPAAPRYSPVDGAPVPDTWRYDPDPLVDVLIAHQRHDARGCLCGPLPLGSSHAQHVADIARPVVEARVRAQIAADIEAARIEWLKYAPTQDEVDHAYVDGKAAGMATAERIARGEA